MFLAGTAVLSLVESEYTVLENEQRVTVCIVLQEGQLLSELALPHLLAEPGTAEESENSNT